MPVTRENNRALICSIGTSVPESRYTQEQALEFMKSIPSYGESDRSFLERIYPASAIETRHSVIADWSRKPSEFTFFSRNGNMHPEPGLRRRNELFAEESPAIAERAARRAIEANDEIAIEDITHIITVSCTGFTAPGIDYQLIRRLGLGRNVHRFHVGFMGCYAVYPALKMADSFVRNDPDATVLIVALELCTLHVQFKQERETMVANSLFADGCAACVVAAEGRYRAPGAYGIEAFASTLIDDSESDMAWNVGDVAFDMRLSAYVPKIVEKNVPSIVDTLCDMAGVDRATIDRWAIHPGGRAVLDRVKRGLGLDHEALRPSFDILRRYGNMSSPTILFVLKGLLEDETRRPDRGETVFSAAFGPGLTVESALLTVR